MRRASSLPLFPLLFVFFTYFVLQFLVLLVAFSESISNGSRLGSFPLALHRKLAQRTCSIILPRELAQRKYLRELPRRTFLEKLA